MKRDSGMKMRRVIYLRRLSQLFVITLLIVVPAVTMNSFEWSPSRIVLGHLPPPTIRNISGDTWVFTIGGFRFVHPIAFMDGILSARVIYIPYLLGLIIPLFITIVLGRVFCSWLCPVGFILELNQRTTTLLKRMGLNHELRLPDIRYLLLSVMLLLSFILSTPVVSVIDPPHMLGRELIYLFTHHSVSLTGVSILSGIILFEGLSTSRAWCSSLCPSGGGLSILGAKRVLRIGMERQLCTRCGRCDERCPYNLEPMRLLEDEPGFDWIKCDNCGLCRDVCPTGAIKYMFRRR